MKSEITENAHYNCAFAQISMGEIVCELSGKTCHAICANFRKHELRTKTAMPKKQGIYASLEKLGAKLESVAK